MKKILTVLSILFLGTSGYCQDTKDSSVKLSDFKNSWYLDDDTSSIFILRSNGAYKYRFYEYGDSLFLGTIPNISNPFESDLVFHPYDFLGIYDSTTIKKIWNLK